MSSLRVAQVVEDTEAEGPGRRFALWVKGCSRRCPGCCNPEMWAPEGGDVVEVHALVERIVAHRASVEGLSLLGGEPFEQAGPAAELCRGVRDAGMSVVIFSGFELEALRRRAEDDADVGALLEQCDMLIDGPFRQDLLDRERRWVGSSNQRVHFFGGRYGPDDLAGADGVEIRWSGGVLTVNGWPGFEVGR